MYGLDGKFEATRFDNPTLLALGMLRGPAVQNGALLDSFLEAGGAPALVRLLGESTCSSTVNGTTQLIITFLQGPETGPSGTMPLSAEIAEGLLNEGESRVLWQSARGIRKFTRLPKHKSGPALSPLCATATPCHVVCVRQCSILISSLLIYKVDAPADLRMMLICPLLLLTCFPLLSLLAGEMSSSLFSAMCMSFISVVFSRHKTTPRTKQVRACKK
jgi:hypothetical protein